MTDLSLGLKDTVWRVATRPMILMKYKKKNWKHETI